MKIERKKEAKSKANTLLTEMAKVATIRSAEHQHVSNAISLLTLAFNSAQVQLHRANRVAVDSHKHNGFVGGMCVCLYGLLLCFLRK